MADEIRLAFAHPAERAIATADEAPRDRISLRDHVVEVEIGAFQAERGHTQRVRFNIVVEVRSGTGPLEDDVDRILSYDKVTEAIALELAAERVNLLETLAERIAERILLEPQAMRAFVRIEKLDRGPGALGVEIVRAAPEARRAGDLGQVAPPVDRRQHGIGQQDLVAHLFRAGGVEVAVRCDPVAPGFAARTLVEQAVVAELVPRRAAVRHSSRRRVTAGFDRVK